MRRRHRPPRRDAAPAGRAKRRNVTIAATGIAGQADERRRGRSGREPAAAPGLMARRQKCRSRPAPRRRLGRGPPRRPRPRPSSRSGRAPSPASPATHRADRRRRIVGSRMPRSADLAADTPRGGASSEIAIGVVDAAGRQTGVPVTSRISSPVDRSAARRAAMDRDLRANRSSAAIRPISWGAQTRCPRSGARSRPRRRPRRR